MSTRLYLQKAGNGLSGTFPTAHQSSATANWTATGATTLHQMTLQTGGSEQQTSNSGSTQNTSATQNGFCAMFVSQPLNGAQTVGGGTMVINCGSSQSNTNCTFRINSANVYVWRPSTGAKVGTVSDAIGAGTTGSSTASGTSAAVDNFTLSSSAVSASDGDVIIIELWGRFTQSMSTSYTATTYWGGHSVQTTENASILGSHAAFFELAEDIKFKRTTPLSFGFANDLNTFSTSNCTTSLVGGDIMLTATGASPLAWWQFTTVKGVSYTLHVAMVGKTGTSATATVDVSTNGSSVDINTHPIGSTVPLYADFSFTAEGTATYVRLSGASTNVAGDTITFSAGLVHNPDDQSIAPPPMPLIPAALLTR